MRPLLLGCRDETRRMKEETCLSEPKLGQQRRELVSPRRLVKRLVQIGDVKARDGTQGPFPRRMFQGAEEGFKLRRAQNMRAQE